MSFIDGFARAARCGVRKISGGFEGRAHISRCGAFPLCCVYVAAARQFGVGRICHQSRLYDVGALSEHGGLRIQLYDGYVREYERTVPKRHGSRRTGRHEILRPRLQFRRRLYRRDHCRGEFRARGADDAGSAEGKYQGAFRRVFAA